MRVDRLVFGGGIAPGSDPLVLNPTSITVFIGPNNGGKSTALRDIQSRIFRDGRFPAKVVLEADLAPIDIEEQLSKIESVMLGRDENNPGFYSIGRRANFQPIHETLIDPILQDRKTGSWSSVQQAVLQHFILNLNGEARLTLTNPTQSQRLGDKAMSTIAAIFKDDVLRAKISKVVYDAFGLHLVIDPTQMSAFNYALSNERPPKEIERSFGDQAIDFFSRAEPLSAASDGTKAFVGVITEFLAGNSDIVFIDEPEAFLHPGLAYALGREISTNVSVGKQLFAATHSPQFLMGCLSSGVRVNVVRLSRRGNCSIINLLDSAKLESMMLDPLLRSSNVISGLFYNSAVVVEGDSDRSFYEEINFRLGLVNQDIRHPIFINAHSKQTAPIISNVLRSAGVPAAMVLDLDWIKEDGVVYKKYIEGSGIPIQAANSIASARSQTRKDLESTGKNYKREGGIDLLSGAAKVAADDFLDRMEQYGLFTVRRGEVEAWLSDLPISRAKQGWLEAAFSAMGSDVSAPTYLKPSEGDVWEFLKSVATWIADPQRRGMPI